ncbi:MAG: hypothetical protein PHD02_05105 [Bacilli bacterium]|nr:hypothetical protein [Bacilli bacterium]
MLEIGVLITICFLVIFNGIVWALLINKQLNNFNTLFLEMHKDLVNFNKELNLLKNNVFSKNDSIKNPVSQNSTVDNKKNSNTLDPNLIRGSQMTGIPIEKLSEIVKEGNKLCSTQVKIKSGQNISEVNMKIDDDKIINNSI